MLPPGLGPAAPPPMGLDVGVPGAGQFGSKPGTQGGGVSGPGVVPGAIGVSGIVMGPLLVMRGGVEGGGLL